MTVFEMEASRDEINVSDILDRVNRGITDPGKPGLKPDNVGDYSAIDVGLLPKLPDDLSDLYGEGPDDPGTEDPHWDDPGDGDGGGDGDAGAKK